MCYKTKEEREKTKVKASVFSFSNDAHHRHQPPKDGEHNLLYDSISLVKGKVTASLASAKEISMDVASSF